MSFKSNIEKPYYSKTPLNKDSIWITFPVAIYVLDKNYSSGLEYGKEIISKLESAMANLTLDIFPK